MGEREQLYCIIRKERVAALPEEKVRQSLLSYMIGDLGYPAPLVTVEQPLKSLPHLSISDSRRVPDRRADILCFAKTGNRPLFPLVLVECKAVKFSSHVINQVLGYNHFIGAPFITLANQEEIRTGWYDRIKGEYNFVDFLPPYADLVKSL